MIEATTPSKLAENVRRCEAENTHATLAKISIPTLIASDLSHVMAPAVDFHREPELRAVEVHDPRADRMLATEAQTTCRATAQSLPERDLRRRHCAAEIAGAAERQAGFDHMAA